MAFDFTKLMETASRNMPSDRSGDVPLGRRLAYIKEKSNVPHTTLLDKRKSDPPAQKSIQKSSSSSRPSTSSSSATVKPSSSLSSSSKFTPSKKPAISSAQVAEFLRKKKQEEENHEDRRRSGEKRKMPDTRSGTDKDVAVKKPKLDPEAANRHKITVDKRPPINSNYEKMVNSNAGHSKPISKSVEKLPVAAKNSKDEKRPVNAERKKEEGQRNGFDGKIAKTLSQKHGDQKRPPPKNASGQSLDFSQLMRAAAVNEKRRSYDSGDDDEKGKPVIGKPLYQKSIPFPPSSSKSVQSLPTFKKRDDQRPSVPTNAIANSKSKVPHQGDHGKNHVSSKSRPGDPKRPVPSGSSSKKDPVSTDMNRPKHSVSSRIPSHSTSGLQSKSKNLSSQKPLTSLNKPTPSTSHKPAAVPKMAPAASKVAPSSSNKNVPVSAASSMMKPKPGSAANDKVSRTPASAMLESKQKQQPPQKKVEPAKAPMMKAVSKQVKQVTAATTRPAIAPVRPAMLLSTSLFDTPTPDGPAVKKPAILPARSIPPLSKDKPVHKPGAPHARPSHPVPRAPVASNIQRRPGAGPGGSKITQDDLYRRKMMLQKEEEKARLIAARKLARKLEKSQWDEEEEEDEDEDDEEVEEEEEEDSDMADFIDDGPLDEDDQEDYSEHINKIFGYDKRKYKHLDDDDDPNMESNFNEIQKEEKRSEVMGLLEDMEEYKREQAELMKKGKKKK